MTILKSAQRANKKIAALLEKVRSYSQPDRIKRAYIGGEQDAGFEQSFASLAYAYIQDKSPGLLDFIVGFQLVEKSDDNKRAAGVFGFKLGPQWIYAPVFFLQGNLKGSELLYLKQQDGFVPNKENWVNFLLAKRPHILGDVEESDRKELGIGGPDLTALTEGAGKHAFYVPPRLQKWAKDMLPLLGSWVTQSPAKLEKVAGLNDRLDLRNVLSSDVRFAQQFFAMTEQYPDIKLAADELYGPSLLRDALTKLKTATCDAQKKSVLRKPSKVVGRQSSCTSMKCAEQNDRVRGEAPKVTIIDRVNKDSLPGNLSDEEKSQLIENGYVIRDSRKPSETSQVFTYAVNDALENPTETGVYQVLMDDGNFEKCLVLVHPEGCTASTAGYSLVIRLEPKAHLIAATNRIFVKPNSARKQDFDAWFEKLETSTNLSEKAYAIITPAGTGTVTFEVISDLGDDLYQVYMSQDWNTIESPYRKRDIWDKRHPGFSKDYDKRNQDSVDGIQFNRRPGSSFYRSGHTLYIPNAAKVIPLKSDVEKSGPESPIDIGGNTKYQPIRLGTPETLLRFVHNKTAMLKVSTDQNETYINGSLFTGMSAIRELVTGFGLREKQAKHILREAAVRGTYGEAVKYRLILAPYYKQALAPAIEEPTQQGTAGFLQTPVFGTQQQETRVDGLDDTMSDGTEYSLDPNVNPDAEAMQVAMQGHQKGQKEIFDTAILSSMLKGMQDDTMTDRYLGDLVKALDRVGRILFLFYWHNDRFSERYGKSDMPELEDSLRSAFEVLGDLVLFLKQKTIEPSVETAAISESSVSY